MAVVTLLWPAVFIVGVICISFSSGLDATRVKRASLIPRYFTNMPISKCSSIINKGCCQHSNCCLDNCCCDQLCHDSEFNDCCSDIYDVGCFARDAPRNCRAAGYTSGCCVENASQKCFVQAGNCSCASSCHQQRNCCPDIEDTGCAGPMNCSAAGHTNGCCVGNTNKNNCHVPADNCSCDMACHRREDCCPDIIDIGCLAPTTSPPTFPPTTQPPVIPGCVSEGYSNGCCRGSRCSVRVRVGRKRKSCSCSESCYDMKTKTGGNRCCEDIKAIHCYPQTCKQANMENCNVTNQNNCSFQIAKNGSLCYCGEGCVERSRCCESMEYLNAKANRLQTQLLRIQKVISHLQNDVKQVETDSFADGLSYSDLMDYILMQTLHARRNRQYTQKFGELSNYQKSFGDELREKVNQLANIIDEDKRNRNEERFNSVYSRLHQMQHGKTQRLKTSNNYSDEEKHSRMLYLVRLLQAMNRQQ